MTENVKRDTRRQKSQSPTDAAAPRPAIEVTPRVDRMVEELTDALKDYDVYQHSGRLVRVLAGPHGVHITAIARASMSELASSVADFVTTQGLRVHEVAPPKDLLDAVHARGAWPGIRPLDGLITAPSIRIDGTVIDRPGYDAASRFLYLPTQEYPEIQAMPTLDECRRAFEHWCLPFRGFCFQSDEHMLVPLAAALTMIVRPAVAGAVPAFVFDAPVAGTGKSLLARVVTTLAIGQEAPVMTWPGESSELGKVLDSFAMSGARVVNFDNVEAPFGGAALNKLLTCADTVELRVLGKSRVHRALWRGVVLATGNNIRINGDANRRVFVCRLDSGLESPEERSGFAIADPVAWCRAEHPQLVAAGLTMIRGFIAAGRPRVTGVPMGSFESWHGLVAATLHWISGKDVTTCRATHKQDDDDDKQALRIILAQLPLLVPAGATVREIVTLLYRHPKPNSEAIASLRDALETWGPPRHAGGLPDTRALGHAFGRHAHRPLDGRMIVKCGERSHSSRWRVDDAPASRRGSRGSESTL